MKCDKKLIKGNINHYFNSYNHKQKIMNFNNQYQTRNNQFSNTVLQNNQQTSYALFQKTLENFKANQNTMEMQQVFVILDQ